MRVSGVSSGLGGLRLNRTPQRAGSIGLGFRV